MPVSGRHRACVIGYLRGLAVDSDVIDVNGVGYLVHTPRPLTVGAEACVWVHTAVRENDISLYGFDTRAERELFCALTRVPGVGPKTALAAVARADQVAAALAANDVSTMPKIPGIGPKTAQAILTQVNVPATLLTELGGHAPDPSPQDELTGALISMGFAPADARSALAAAREADPDAPSAAWLKSALRHLRGPAAVPAA